MNRLFKYKQHIAIFILTLFLLTPVLPVFAHDAVFLQTVLDVNNKKYVSTVLTDKPGFSNELKHMEPQLGDFIGGSVNLVTSVDKPLEPFVNNISTFEGLELGKGETNTGITRPATDRKTMVYTFPSKEEDGFLWFGNKNHATSEDVDRAFYIANELTGNLNSLLSYVNNGKPFVSEEHLIKTSIYIRPDSGNTSHVPGPDNTYFLIEYDQKIDANDPDAKEKGYLKGRAYRADASGNKLKGTEEQPFEFVYAIAKGYVPIEGNTPYIRPNQDPYDFISEDTAWITIHHLSFQANYANTIGVNYQSGTPEQSLNAFQKIIKEFLLDLLYGLLNLLGLYNIEELVYNEGIRGSEAYNDGMMSSQWWDVVLRYHVIFQAIAWALIAGALIKILIQINFSTVNPAIRMNLYQTFEKLFIVGVLLSAIIPIVRLFASFNNSIVKIFASQVDLSTSGRMATHGGFIAGIIIEFFYFSITLYMNFVYIMRSIMLAILIASAPFFIVTMAFSWKGKGLFDGWFKELVANLFLQAFHAFSFAFIFNIQGSGRGIESLVAIASLIPLTEFFRGLIFGGAGSGAINIGKGLGQQADAMAKGAIGAGIGRANSAIAGKIAESSIGGESQVRTGGNSLNAGSNSLDMASSKLKEMSEGSFGKAQAEQQASESTGGIVRGADGQLTFASGGGKGTALLQKASGIGLGVASSAGKTLGGLSDVASGNVFGNQAQAVSGAKTMGSELGNASMDAVEGGLVAGQAIGQVGKGAVSVGVKSAKEIDSNLFDGRGADFLDKTKNKAVGFAQGVKNSDIVKGATGTVNAVGNKVSGKTQELNQRYKASGIGQATGIVGKNIRGAMTGGGYHIGTRKDAMGNNMYDLDTKAMAQQTGIEDISMFKQGNKNFVSTTLNANNMSLTDESGNPTSMGRDLSHLMHLSQDAGGRELLKSEYGIQDVRSLGNGKIQIIGNEKYMERQGITNIEKSSNGSVTRITKTAGSGAGMNIMPKVSESAVREATSQPLNYTSYIGGNVSGSQSTRGSIYSGLNNSPNANDITPQVQKYAENKNNAKQEGFNKGASEARNNYNNPNDFNKQ